MSQTEFIKNLARYGLDNDQDNLYKSLNELIDYFREHKKVNLAIQLQAMLKEALRQQHHGLVKVGSPQYINRQEEK